MLEKMFRLLKENKQQMSGTARHYKTKSPDPKTMGWQWDREKDTRTSHYKTNKYKGKSNGDPWGEVSNSA